MSAQSKFMCGFMLLTMPSIQYGGYFLFSLLRGNHSHLNLTAFQRSMFRAGHAHAGVLMLLSLLAQPFVDFTSLHGPLAWGVRTSFPLASLLISGGFFFSAIGSGRTTPNRWVYLLYTGIVLLALGFLVLGYKLLRASVTHTLFS